MRDTAYVSFDCFDQNHFHNRWCLSIKCTLHGVALVKHSESVYRISLPVFVHWTTSANTSMLKTSRNNKDLREVSNMNREEFDLTSRRYYRDTEISHCVGIVVRAVYVPYVESGMFVEDKFLIVVTLFTSTRGPCGLLTTNIVQVWRLQNEPFCADAQMFFSRCSRCVM